MTELLRVLIKDLVPEAAAGFPDLKPPIPPAPPRPILFVPGGDRVLYCPCVGCVHRRKFGWWLRRIRTALVWLGRGIVGGGITLGLAGYPEGYWVAGTAAFSYFHGAFVSGFGEIVGMPGSVRDRVLRHESPGFIWGATHLPDEIAATAHRFDLDEADLDEDTTWLRAVETHDWAGTLPAPIKVWLDAQYAAAEEEE